MSGGATLSFDIFCRVIDNFGDIGVCWRLARQLAGAPHNYTVRLWVDHLSSFSKIEPSLNAAQNEQTVQGVQVIHWTPDPPDLPPHQVVIEAFACDPPPAFLARMAQQRCVWINLEYLSAEAWVEGCHALKSLQPNGLQKIFFFPGFTDATGGLLREAGLLATRNAWLSEPALRWQLLHDIHMPAPLIHGLQNGWRQVFLFCYPSAPAKMLIRALQQQATPTVVIVPQGVYPSLALLQDEQVRVFEPAFVDQHGFDRLLWSSDLNFVRGEDSLVRALWSGKPLVWQIYEQSEDAHLVKLHAWLAHSPLQPIIHQLMDAWNTRRDTDFDLLLNQALHADRWQQWQHDAFAWCTKLGRQTDLAQALVEFCAKNRRTG